jgi:hypothetical protein
MSLQLPKLDPAEVATWIDDWSAQIATAAAEDPHRPFSLDDHEDALDRMRSYSPARAEYLQRWVDCWSSGGDDADGDGFDLCHDCQDANAAQSPAAVEVCDEIDNNCDGRVDNLAAGATCTEDPEMAKREAFWRHIYIDVKAEARLRRGSTGVPDPGRGVPEADGRVAGGAVGAPTCAWHRRCSAAG